MYAKPAARESAGVNDGCCMTHVAEENASNLFHPDLLVNNCSQINDMLKDVIVNNLTLHIGSAAFHSGDYTACGISTIIFAISSPPFN